MSEFFEDYSFTPKCFHKDLKKIFRYMREDDSKEKKLLKGVGARVFEIENNKSFVYMVTYKFK
jgi:hypothetical protein